ncbi:MAG: hypothetical protein HYY01_13545 [Chloroflexi bacterium]|nr:hypothetical protein [Chloroflexota bacterium]
MVGVLSVLVFSAGCGEATTGLPSPSRRVTPAQAPTPTGVPTAVALDQMLPPTPPAPTLKGKDIQSRPDSYVGTYRTTTLALATPQDVMRVVGRITLEGRADKPLLITNYLEPFCYPPLSAAPPCRPLPEPLRERFGIEYGTWWTGNYVTSSSGDEWVWEQQKPRAGVGQIYSSFDSTDLYVFVPREQDFGPVPVLKFENMKVVAGQTVRLPDIVVPVLPAEEEQIWVLFPAQ